MNLDYLGPFRTTEFDYMSDSIVDIEIQPFYDGSVNIITASKGTLPRIVNSRQKFSDIDVELIVRKNNNLDNVYSDFTIEKTLLVPQLSERIPSIDFIEVRKSSGKLKNGGYKYYFRLKTSDGIESALIEESRLVSVHSGTKFGEANTFIDDSITNNSVKFNISNIDTRVYKYVSVYYTRATGQTPITSKAAFRIDKDYKILDDGISFVGTCGITHTGFETSIPVDITDLTIEYSPIDSVSTLSQKNNRLLLGNIKATSIKDDLLKTAALNCYILENPDSKLFIEQDMYKGNTYTKIIAYLNAEPVGGNPTDTFTVLSSGALAGDVLIINDDTVVVIKVTTNLTGLIIKIDRAITINSGDSVYKRKGIDDTYADPNNVYKKLGYFPGETYEFAINFVFKNGSVSRAYPIMGHDYEQPNAFTYQEFDKALLGTDIGWNGVQNSYGVVRMVDIPIQDTFTANAEASENLATMDTYSLHVDTSKIYENNLIEQLQDLGVISYFVSRKKRIPDLLMEGLLTLAATAPVSSMHPTDLNTYIFGMNAGYGLEGSLAGNLVLFPLPGSALPVSSERILGDKNYYFDGILYSPLASAGANKYYALYSPDIASDTSISSLINTKSQYSIKASALLSQSMGYSLSEAIVHIGANGPTRYAYNANPHRFTSYAGSYEQIEKLQFVNDGTRSFSSLGFTGRLDRQVALSLYTYFRSYSSAGNSVDPPVSICEAIDRGEQATYSSTNLNISTNLNKYYNSHTSLEVSGCSINVESDPNDKPMAGVKYSPYIGLSIEGTNLTDKLSITEDTASPKTQGYFTGYGRDVNMLPADNDTMMGAMVRVYNSSSGILTVENWIDKYSVRRPDGYSAITKRYDIAYPLSKYIDWHDSYLSGGDCYAGIYYQRVWRPGGIDGIPTATNPGNYIDDGTGTPITREGVNITNSGYAIGFPVRSSYNFAIRASYEEDVVETKLYGKNRTYTSSSPNENIHGDRQPESASINYGNIIDESIVSYAENDPTIPYIQLDYDNRVMVSDISIIGEFENGYRDFKGLNFKDYDEELGPITAVVSTGVYTYLILANGVSMIELSERIAVTSKETDNNVYISAANVLPPKSTPIFTNIGSQHLKSVLPAEIGVFGVDAESKKIWFVNIKEKKLISEMLIQSILNKLITDDIKDIITSYDVLLGEVTFVFIYNDDSQKSILYNVINNVWYGTTDIHKVYQFNLEEGMLSLQKPSSSYNLYYPVLNNVQDSTYDSVGKATAIDDLETGTKEVYDSYIEFVVRQKDYAKFDLSSIIINGSGVPKEIKVISDEILDYTVGITHTNISSIAQSTLSVHTNIYMRDADAANLSWVDSYTFIRNWDINFKLLNAGDKITLLVDSKYQQFTIARVTYVSETSPNTIILSNEMEGTNIQGMYIGWKIPVRLSLGESMGGKTKLTIPSRKHASILSGVSNTPQQYKVNNSNAKPYGRWVKLRLYFHGIEQINIESIVSEATIRYS